MVQERNSLNTVGRILQSHALILFSFVILIWLLEFIDIIIFHQGLNALGVRPRTLTGLFGIILMPILHNGIGHLVANTIPFLVLGWLVMVRRTADFFFVTFMVILVSGLGVWLLGGTNTVHIGASGLIFGYFGFLVLRGYFERSFISIAIALIVVFFYGGLIWGVFPNFQAGVSWLGHLFGFFGGAWSAYLVTTRRQRTEFNGRIL